ncbi:MAG TPA: DUF4126 domain-containing protein [Bryobacteraceae bacterium]|jgi:hypothetical protein|nr:DUF4126 domain-containing protein [Bryobacteraceae bacterium]
MDITTLGFAMGSAWLSGINLYATVLTLGLLQRFGFVSLPGDLSYLSHTWILSVSGALYCVQFLADKIPALDSAWDLVHTFIRVPAGAVLAAAAFAHFDPRIQLLALLLGGGVALSSHGAKTATRLAANASPEPFSNIALSIAGDVLAIGGTLLMAVHPLVWLVIVFVALAVSFVLLRWIWRQMNRVFSSKTLTSRPPV